jgi:hypothetical protein
MVGMIQRLGDESLMQQVEGKEIHSEDDELSLVDIIRFFSRNGKFILLTTLGLWAIAIALSLLQPKPAQYQKQLSLSVRAARAPVSAFPDMDDNQASALAVKFLENLKLDQVTAQTKYEPTAKQIDVTLQSPNPNALSDTGSKTVRQVETGFEQIVGQSVDTTLFSLETEIQKNKQILNQLKQPSTQFSPTNEFRLGATETQTEYLATLTGLEFDKRYLEQAKNNLAEYTAKLISVQILTESDKPPQRRSLVQLAVIAAIGSFILAVFTALVRDQVLRLKKELSRNKIEGSQDV